MFEDVHQMTLAVENAHRCRIVKPGAILIGWDHSLDTPQVDPVIATPKSS